MDNVAIINAGEVVWWTALGLWCWWIGRGLWKIVSWATAGWLLLFAITDIIELQTGAWWHPWWLAVTKGACLLGLAGCGVWAWQIKRMDLVRHDSNHPE